MYSLHNIKIATIHDTAQPHLLLVRVTKKHFQKLSVCAKKIRPFPTEIKASANIYIRKEDDYEPSSSIQQALDAAKLIEKFLLFNEDDSTTPKTRIRYLIKYKTNIGIAKIDRQKEWHQDLSSDMKIGLADGGYEKVKLRCSADFMHVDLVTDQDFSGVIYTRGSFHKKKPPCFLNPQRAGREFTLKIPLNKCQTLQDGDIYSNVVVVQYDKDLIMPGDAAFTLECDFSRPRDITVSANLNAEKKVAASRISLIDADPAAESLPRHKRSFVERNGEEVEFTPADVVKDNAPSSSRKVDDEL